MIYLVTLVLGLIFFLIWYSKRKPENFPSGPPRIPLLGSIPFLPGIGIEKFVSEKVSSYGPITGFYIGQYPTVVINDFKLAKYIFNRDEVSGRVSNYTTKWARATGGKNLGIVTTQGRRWNGQRSFTLKHLKKFGLGKNYLQGVIQKEAMKMVEDMLVQGGRVVKMQNTMFAIPVLNVLWDMVAGYSFSKDDPGLIELLDLVNFVFSSSIFLAATSLPWIRFIFPSFTGYNKRLRAIKSMQDLIRKEIRNHQADFDENNPRDLIDSYLIEMKNNNDSEFNEEQLVMIGMDLMSAGFETTSTTLLWAVMYMTLHQDIQEKCYNEIFNHLRHTQEVTLEDMEYLQFCQATIAEVQRLSCVALASLPHMTTTKIEIPTGHVLSPGTMVISNIKQFNNDPDLWHLPEIFNPSRFLTDEGKFVKPDNFVPFGHGRRICIGEPLARDSLFTFFVSLVRKIKFVGVPGNLPDPRKYSAGLTKSPDTFSVDILERHNNCQ